MINNNVALVNVLPIDDGVGDRTASPNASVDCRSRSSLGQRKKREEQQNGE
jgi:hypothetical protein